MWGVFVSWMNVTANRLRMSGGGAPSFENTKSISFDNVDDSLVLNHTFDATNGLTYSCWIKPSPTASILNFLSSNGGTGGAKSQFNMRIVADGRWFIYFHGSATYTNITGLTDGNWHHIAMTVNYSNGDVHFYKDGVVSSTVLTWGSTYSTAVLKCIGSANTSGVYSFGGEIDEFSIFESIENIATLYNGGMPGDLSGLSPSLWYRMGDGDTYPTITDNGSATADGTMTNMSSGDIIDDTINNPPFNAKSLEFDGIDDNVNMGNPTELQITGAMSISFWFKSTSTATGDNDMTIAKDDFSNRSYAIWTQAFGTTKVIEFRIFSSGASTIVQTASDYQDGLWHHVLCVFVPSTSIKIYVDGVNDGSNTTSIPSTIDNDPADFKLGGNPSYSLLGNLDEVAIWNSDQTSNLSAIYNSGTPDDLSSLSPVGWWRNGDGDTYDIITDHGSGGNDGTMTNMSSGDIVEDVPPNPFNIKSLAFDGVDDEVILGSQFTLSGAFTLSMWIKPVGSWLIQFIAGNSTNSDFIRPRSTTVIDLKINNTQTTVTESGGNDLVASAWQHLLITRDASNNITVYRNGATFGSSFVDSDDWDFDRFGTGWASGGWNYEGGIDELSYWNSEESVSTIYNSGVPADLTSLNPVGWYRNGDGDTYPTITDNGSASNDGTMTNMNSGDIVTDVP